MESFSKFGVQLDEETQQKLDRGRAIRSVLQQIQFSPMDVATQIAVFLAVNHGLFDKLNDTQIRKAQEIIHNFCKSNVYKELKNMEFLAAEFPITIMENGLIKNGIIDALFKTKEGNILIIDFKSDKINVVTDKTVEPEYLKQIAFYKNALKGIFKENIESALIYIRPAKIYKVEE